MHNQTDGSMADTSSSAKSSRVTMSLKRLKTLQLPPATVPRRKSRLPRAASWRFLPKVFTSSSKSYISCIVTPTLQSINFRHGRADEFGLQFQSFTVRLAGLLGLLRLLGLLIVLTQLQQMSIHPLVDLEWAMCWLEPSSLASLVLPFDLESPTPLVTQRRDLEVVDKFENHVNKIARVWLQRLLKSAILS